MRRALVGICVGAATGLLSVAGVGAWIGYVYSDEFAVTPGFPLRWAALFANEAVHAYWWLAVGVGGVMGGLGSWFGRPRKSSTVSASTH
jgi:hypothetical protein